MMVSRRSYDIIIIMEVGPIIQASSMIKWFVKLMASTFMVTNEIPILSKPASIEFEPYISLALSNNGIKKMEYCRLAY